MLCTSYRLSINGSSFAVLTRVETVPSLFLLGDKMVNIGEPPISDDKIALYSLTSIPQTNYYNYFIFIWNFRALNGELSSMHCNYKSNVIIVIINNTEIVFSANEVNKILR